jgi:hypothetical protein
MRTVPASFVREFVDAAESSDDLARPALLMARLEYPGLDPTPYLERLEEIGREAGARLAGTCLDRDLTDRVGALSAFLFRTPRRDRRHIRGIRQDAPAASRVVQLSGPPAIRSTARPMALPGLGASSTRVTEP